MPDTATDRPPVPLADVTGVILAGGRGSRMGGIDKGLVLLNGEPMIAHVLRRLRPQVEGIVINANRHLDRYARFDCVVVPDMYDGYSGPLAGMASALDACLCSRYILTVPCDCPLLPAQLAPRLYQGLKRSGADICCAHDGSRSQPVFALISRRLLPSLRSYLEAGERKIDRWFQQQAFTSVDFTDQAGAFANINTEQDRRRLEARLHGQVIRPANDGLPPRHYSR